MGRSERQPDKNDAIYISISKVYTLKDTASLRVVELVKIRARVTNFHCSMRSTPGIRDNMRYPDASGTRKYHIAIGSSRSSFTRFVSLPRAWVVRYAS